MGSLLLLETTKLVSFSRMERDVLALLCLGCTPKLIAYELEVTAACVNIRIGKICRKAWVNRSEIVIYALQHPAALERDGEAATGLHPPKCACDAPYCKGRRRAA
jgi:DNA-binding CsgD family transcriptional regulator